MVKDEARLHDAINKLFPLMLDSFKRSVNFNFHEDIPTDFNIDYEDGQYIIERLVSEGALRRVSRKFDVELTKKGHEIAYQGWAEYIAAKISSATRAQQLERERERQASEREDELLDLNRRATDAAVNSANSAESANTIASKAYRTTVWGIVIALCTLLYTVWDNYNKSDEINNLKIRLDSLTQVVQSVQLKQRRQSQVPRQTIALPDSARILKKQSGNQ